jgi:uncharacterized RDD family membrane protein YckC
LIPSVQEPPPLSEPAEPRAPSPPGFWRRPLAMVLDCLVLGCVGFTIGLAFFDPLCRLGAWGRLIGFPMALLYFGILNSRLGGGQTLGKRALRIRVVDSSGLPLPEGRSMVRFLIIGVPYFVNGLALPTSRVPVPILYMLAFLVFGLGGSIVYLYLFNRATRRSLHDLLVGSSVVSVESAGVPAGRLWKGHVVILALILGIAGPSTAWMGRQLSARFGLPALLKTVAAIEGSRDVRAASVNAGTMWGGKGTSRYVSVTALLVARPQSLADSCDAIGAIVLRAMPEIMDKDVLTVTVAYGFDIGIASGMRHFTKTLPPVDWAKRVTAAHPET